MPLPQPHPRRRGALEPEIGTEHRRPDGDRHCTSRLQPGHQSTSGTGPHLLGARAEHHQSNPSMQAASRSAHCASVNRHVGRFGHGHQSFEHQAGLDRSRQPQHGQADHPHPSPLLRRPGSQRQRQADRRRTMTPHHAAPLHRRLGQQCSERRQQRQRAVASRSARSGAGHQPTGGEIGQVGGSGCHAPRLSNTRTIEYGPAVISTVSRYASPTYGGPATGR